MFSVSPLQCVCMSREWGCSSVKPDRAAYGLDWSEQSSMEINLV